MYKVLEYMFQCSITRHLITSSQFHSSLRHNSHYQLASHSGVLLLPCVTVLLQPWGNLLVTFVLGSPLVGVLVVLSGGSDGVLVAVSALES